MGGRRHEGASLAVIEAAYRDGFERFAIVAAAILGSQAAARDAVQDGFAAAIRNRRQFRGDDRKALEPVAVGRLDYSQARPFVPPTPHTRTTHGGRESL